MPAIHRGGIGPVRRTVTAVLLAAVVSVGIAGPARGERIEGTPNWPELLPPRPDASGHKVRLAFDVCRRGRARCPRRVVREMRRRWIPLDESCDHRAVFALTYLRTTEEFVRTTTADPAFFSGPRWINHEDTVFAELYFRAYDRWERGAGVPEAWRIAFEASRSRDVTGLGDLLLGMNAHINRDLPYALSHVGLRRRSGASRKPDHDRVNAFLERVADPLQVELARRYDPLFRLTDAEPSPLDETGALEMVRGFRENAWRNAERLVVAGGDPRQLAAVRQSIELEAATTARAIVAANTAPGYGAVRDAHCRS